MGIVADARVKVTSDSADAIAGLQNISKAVSDVGKAGENVEGLTTAFDSAAAAIGSTERRVAMLTAQLKTERQAAREAASVHGQFSAATAAADARVGQLIQQLDREKVALNKLRSAASKTQKPLAGLGKGIATVAGGLGLVVGAAGAVRVISNFGKEAFDAHLQGQLFDVTLQNVAGSAHLAAAGLNAVDVATRGTLDASQQAALTSKLFSLGLADNAEQAGKFANTAATLGRAFRGISAAESVALFNRLISNRSIKLLDDFGIGIGAVNARMKELGVTGQEGFGIAVMDVAAKKAEQLGDVWDTDATKVEQLKAEFRDFRREIGEDIAPIAIDVIFSTRELKENQDAFTQSILDSSDSFEEYSQKVREAGASSQSFRQNTTILTESQFNLAKAFEGTSQANFEVARNTAVAAREAERFEQVNQQLDNQVVQLRDDLATYNDELQTQAGLQLTALKSVEGLTAAGAGQNEIFDTSIGLLGDLGLSTSDLNTAYQELGLATGAVTPEQIAQADSMRMLANLYNSGAISADDFAGALGDIQAGADATVVAQEALAEANKKVEESIVSQRRVLGEEGALRQAVEEADVAGVAEGITVDPEQLNLDLLAIQESLNSINAGEGITLSSNALAIIEDEINPLIEEITGIPDGVTKITAPGAGAAKKAIDKIGEALRALPGSLTINIVATSSGSAGRALGGPVQAGVAHTVGEQGRELFVPDANGFIVPAAQTRALMSGDSGGRTAPSVPAVITIVSPVMLDGREIGRSSSVWQGMAEAGAQRGTTGFGDEAGVS